MRVTRLEWTQCAAFEREPGKVSGDWVSKSTRVPVRLLFENLEDVRYGAKRLECAELAPAFELPSVRTQRQQAGRTPNASRGQESSS